MNTCFFGSGETGEGSWACIIRGPTRFCAVVSAVAEVVVRSFGRGGCDARVLLRLTWTGAGEGDGVGFATISGGLPGAGHTGGGEEDGGMGVGVER
jgi:hypothetical protein